jgi:hypothetical protein
MPLCPATLLGSSLLSSFLSRHGIRSKVVLVWSVLLRFGKRGTENGELGEVRNDWAGRRGKSKVDIDIIDDVVFFLFPFVSIFSVEFSFKGVIFQVSANGRENSGRQAVTRL